MFSWQIETQERQFLYKTYVTKSFFVMNILSLIVQIFLNTHVPPDRVRSWDRRLLEKKSVQFHFNFNAQNFTGTGALNVFKILEIYGSLM